MPRPADDGVRTNRVATDARGDARAVCLEAVDASALAELGTGRGGVLGEEGIQTTALRHADERRVVAPRECRPVSETKLEAVDVTLDDGRRVDRDPLQRATGEPAAAGLVTREAGLVGEEHARTCTREVDRGGRACGTGAHDEDVDVLHAANRTRSPDGQLPRTAPGSRTRRREARFTVYSRMPRTTPRLQSPSPAGYPVAKGGGL